MGNTPSSKATAAANTDIPTGHRAPRREHDAPHEDTLCLTILAHPEARRVGEVARLDANNARDEDDFEVWRVSRNELQFGDPYGKAGGAPLESAHPPSPFRGFVSRGLALSIGRRKNAGEPVVRVSVHSTSGSACWCSSDGDAYHTLYASRPPAGLDSKPVHPATSDGVERELCHWLTPVHGALEYPASALDAGIVLLYCTHVGLLLHRYNDFGPDAGLHGRFAKLAGRKLSKGGKPFPGLVGESAAIRKVRRDILQWAGDAEPVLILGETGVGKELCAQAIHLLSGRTGEWNEHNMGVRAEDAFNYVTLFGREDLKNRKRVGMAVKSNGGTLFLDEIGCASFDDQVGLLKFLDSGSVLPLGSSQPITVDTRIVSGTDKPIEWLSLPLRGRLDALPLRVPPLRERRDDVGRLLYHFLRVELAKLSARNGSSPQDGDLTRLLDNPEASGPWLGAEMACVLAAMPLRKNVRDIRHVAVRLVAEHHARPVCELERAMVELRHAQETESDPPPSAPPERSSGGTPRDQRDTAAYERLDEMSDQDLVDRYRKTVFSINRLAREFCQGSDPDGINKMRQRLTKRLRRAPEVFFNDLSFEERLRALENLQPRAGERGPSVHDVLMQVGASEKGLKDWLTKNQYHLTPPLRMEWIEFLRASCTGRVSDVK